MKIENLPRDDNQVKLIAEFDQETLEKYSHRAAREIAKQSKIPGFRPGKAPYSVIQQKYGDEFIQQQAIELLIDDQYAEVIKEANIEPAGAGSLEEIISVNPPKFSFIVPLPPVVELCNYRDIRQEYITEETTDEDVEKYIKNLQLSYASSEPVERAVENGDLVYGLIDGKILNPAEGEEVDILKESPSQWIVGGTEFQPDNWPFEGFSNELVGLSEGGEKTFTYTYAEDSEFEKLAGKEIEFTVKIQSVKQLVPPQLDDDFAKQVGNYETVDQMKEGIKSQLAASKTQEYENKYYSDLIDEKIVKESTIKYPPNMLEDEIKNTLEGFKSDLAQQQMDIETYLKMRSKDEATFIEEEIKPAAEKRLVRSLVLEEIARVEKLELPKGELENAVTQTMMQLQSMPGFEQYKSAEKLRSLTNAVAMDEANRLFNQHLLERLKAIATGTLETVVSEETTEEAADQPESPVNEKPEDTEPTSDQSEA